MSRQFIDNQQKKFASHPNPTHGLGIIPIGERTSQEQTMLSALVAFWTLVGSEITPSSMPFLVGDPRG